MPVVVVSSIDSRVFEALHAGAVDYVTKPSGRTPQQMDMMIKELAVKIKIASTANLSHLKRKFSSTALGKHERITKNIIAIGASTGGTEATHQILKSFRAYAPHCHCSTHATCLYKIVCRSHECHLHPQHQRS